MFKYNSCLVVGFFILALFSYAARNDYIFIISIILLVVTIFIYGYLAMGRKLRYGDQNRKREKFIKYFWYPIVAYFCITVIAITILNIAFFFIVRIKPGFVNHVPVEEVLGNRNDNFSFSEVINVDSADFLIFTHMTSVPQNGTFKVTKEEFQVYDTVKKDWQKFSCSSCFWQTYGRGMYIYEIDTTTNVIQLTAYDFPKHSTRSFTVKASDYPELNGFTFVNTLEERTSGTLDDQTSLYIANFMTNKTQNTASFVTFRLPQNESEKAVMIKTDIMDNVKPEVHRIINPDLGSTSKILSGAYIIKKDILYFFFTDYQGVNAYITTIDKDFKPLSTKKATVPDLEWTFSYANTEMQYGVDDSNHLYLLWKNDKYHIPTTPFTKELANRVGYKILNITTNDKVSFQDVTYFEPGKYFEKNDIFQAYATLDCGKTCILRYSREGGNFAFPMINYANSLKENVLYFKWSEGAQNAFGQKRVSIQPRIHWLGFWDGIQTGHTVARDDGSFHYYNYEYAAGRVTRFELK